MTRTTLRFSRDFKGRDMHKRFISYVLSRKSSTRTSVQSACFDTLTGACMFASDLFFKPEELKRW